MQGKSHFILMADVIKSSNSDQLKLMLAFKQAVMFINEKHESLILSPLTITLGDEFQGVVKSIHAAVAIIVDLEEYLIQKKRNFKLRYVLYEGRIDTPINKKIAHGMLGGGLTAARQALSNVKKTDHRVAIKITDLQKSAALTNCFYIFQHIIDDWRIEKDYELVATFFIFDDYKKVAKKLKKNASLIWKRKKSLKIDMYIATKNLLNYLSNA